MEWRLPIGLLCCLAPLLLVTPGMVGAQSDAESLTCYNYTWTGRNITVDCDDHVVDIMNEAQPCLHTLIYTSPHTYPPNTTDIHIHCSTVQKCPSFTCKTEKKKKCIKLSWYDITGTLVNYSSFCGTVTDVTDPAKQVEVGDVQLEMQVGTFTKKMLACSNNLCNAAGTLGGSPGSLVMSMVVMAMMVRMVLGAVEAGDG